MSIHDWSGTTRDRANVAGSRLANAIRERVGTELDGYNFHDQRDAALAELLVSRPVFNAKEFGAKGDGETDDATALQRGLDAIDDAGGGVLVVPPGTYLIESALTAYSDTMMLLDSRATIKRGANTAYMLGNEVSEQGGYDDAENIAVIGGAWDANGSTFTTDMAIMAFAHADGIHIERATLKNVDNFHHVEFAGCRRIRLVDCEIIDFLGATQDMVQFDQARNDTSFPYYDIEFDDTPCVDVEVRGCHFRNGKRAIASHFTSLAEANRDFRIIGNYFNDFDTSTCIVLHGVSGVVVEGNTFTDCERGITIIDEVSAGAGTAATRDLFNISSNNFYGLDNASASHAIRVESTQTDANQQRVGRIAGNLVYDSARHGIVLFWITGWTIEGNVVKDAGDHQGTGCGILLDAANECAVVGNVVTEASEAGIRLTRSTDCVVAANKVYANYRDGILLDNASNDNLVASNVSTENSQETAETYSGIRLTDNCDRVMVAGNLIRGSTDHDYGIEIDAATCEHAFVIGNDVLNSGATGTIGDSGTSTIIRDNRGFVTEVNGTATVANGATTAVVTHGLGVTPALQDISVTPTNDLGNAAKFWISTPTSTQFTINVDADPGADTATFVWTASVQ